MFNISIFTLNEPAAVNRKIFGYAKIIITNSIYNLQLGFRSGNLCWKAFALLFYFGYTQIYVNAFICCIKSPQARIREEAFKFNNQWFQYFVFFVTPCRFSGRHRCAKNKLSRQKQNNSRTCFDEFFLTIILSWLPMIHRQPVY